jgi:mannose-6-phosphate isomerase-like protein (cupin superfamily)
MARKQRLVVGQDEGHTVFLGGIGVVFKLFGEDTHGALSIVEHPVQPGTLVPPHLHEREDEFSYVLEGTFGVKVAEEEFDVPAGCYVLKPRGIPHTFWNVGPGVARLIEIISPPGFDKYFEEMAKLFPKAGGGPDFEKVEKLAESYGLSFYMDWVPELEKKYNIKLLGGQ